MAGAAGNVGFADGVGSKARFNSPTGIGINAGILYVADSGNQTIRKVTTRGAVTTLAGIAGAVGSADGPGLLASFHSPRGLAIDRAGNLYVADSGNNIVRKVTPAGTVTTLAGAAGVDGSADGAPALARFSEPAGAAVDRAGNIYVTDKTNNTIRKVAPNGSVSTLAGSAIRYEHAGASQSLSGSTNATGEWARFSEPSGITLDRAGNVYVTEIGNNMIRRITTAGVVTTFAGSAGDVGVGYKDATGSSARFDSPLAVAADGSDNLYVADMGNNAIRKITPSGTVTTLAKGLQGPRAVTVDAEGNVYFADTPGLHDEDGVVRDSHGASVIRKITPAGVVTKLAGPTFDLNDGTGRAVEFKSPRGLAADRAGNVYVADSGNNAIRKITPAGVVTTLAGAAGLIGSDDGPPDHATFNAPLGLTVDAKGSVYVADTGNNTIRKITPAGEVTTVVGVPAVSGFLPGKLPGQLTAPVAVALSGTTLYITTADAIVQVTHLPP